jgi:regulator of replication initiation timing
MVKHASALATTDLDPIDRLEDKIKLLVNVISQLRAERAHAIDHAAQLTEELTALRARVAAADQVGPELTALREERAAIRTRVADMLQQLEAI